MHVRPENENGAKYKVSLVFSRQTAIFSTLALLFGTDPGVR